MWCFTMDFENVQFHDDSQRNFENVMGPTVLFQDVIYPVTVTKKIAS